MVFDQGSAKPFDTTTQACYRLKILSIKSLSRQPSTKISADPIFGCLCIAKHIFLRRES